MDIVNLDNYHENENEIGTGQGLFQFWRGEALNGGNFESRMEN